MVPHRPLRPVSGTRLEAPAAVGGTSSMKKLFRRRTAHTRVRSDVVVPVLEPRQGGAEGTVVERDELVLKPLLLEGADEPLLHGDAAMPANCAEPRPNVVVVAPFEVRLAELAALAADRVLGHASGTPGRLIKHHTDLVGRRSPLERCKCRPRASAQEHRRSTCVHQAVQAAAFWNKVSLHRMGRASTSDLRVDRGPVPCVRGPHETARSGP
jgi:hypothetical protein